MRQAVIEAIEAVAPGCVGAKLLPERPLRDQIELDSLDWLAC